MPDAPTLHDLVTAPTPPAAGAYAQASGQWRQQRASAQAALRGALPPEQAEQLGALLTLHAHEHALKGAEVGAQAARREARATNGQAAREAAETAARHRQENTRINDLLAQAAADNAALRDRAHRAEQELATLRAALPGMERVIRASIIAAAPADHRPLPRLAPRSGVHHRYLSHGLQIRRVARRIEEFMAGPDCRGYARPEKLREFLLPESPAPVYQQAITHLLLSRRVIQSPSGAYRLRNSTGAPR